MNRNIIKSAERKMVQTIQMPHFILRKPKSVFIYFKHNSQYANRNLVTESVVLISGKLS